MSFERVGIIGAGTMGSGIATNIAQHGIAANLVDISTENLHRAIASAEKFYARNVEKGRMTPEDADSARNRLSAGTDFKALGECDLVIEAVFERFDVKTELYAKIAPMLAEGVVLGTNTSCLKVNALAGGVAEPTNFLGIHYFNPPAISPIVEVVKGDATSPSVVDRIVEFCGKTNKKPVLCRGSSGFALNRFFCPYANEAARLYDEGLGTAAEIDRVASDVLGAAAGPFVVMNLVGMQVMAHAQDNLVELGAFYKPAASVSEKGATGDTWLIEPPASEPDHDRDRVIADRLMGAIFLPVLQELDEAVASPADIDMGAQLALKFGKPPCALMDELGSEEVARVVGPLSELYDAPMPVALERVGKLLK
ncbi:MAG: hypothetical protein CMM48_05350 [Rhodospirillaceae bacterium]|nr:hypothetical protein [Rhodospirillaceae bacterium]